MILQALGFNILSAGSITKVIFSADSVSTNGTSVNSKARRFAGVIRLCETAL